MVCGFLLDLHYQGTIPTSTHNIFSRRNEKKIFIWISRLSGSMTIPASILMKSVSDCYQPNRNPVRLIVV